ncbi:hypothetical protein [Pseudomonas sp.]|uniref:hypothetical protein n=1 Tax=Pseudomonas sp. TaxID=306 RepID=UPI0026325DC0|nr:hypothetical protein [Pseudomonas sp.]
MEQKIPPPSKIMSIVKRQPDGKYVSVDSYFIDDEDNRVEPPQLKRPEDSGSLVLQDSLDRH